MMMKSSGLSFAFLSSSSSFSSSSFFVPTFFCFAFNLRTPHKNARLFARRTTTTTEKKAAQIMASPGEVRATPFFDPVRAFPRSRRLHFSSKRAAFFFSKMCVLHTKCNVAGQNAKKSHRYRTTDRHLSNATGIRLRRRRRRV